MNNNATLQLENKELLQSIFDAAPNSISVYQIIYNGNGEAEDFEIIMFNEFTYRMTGLSAEEAVGKYYSRVFPHTIESGILEKFKHTANTGIGADFEKWYDGDGMSHWFHFIASKKNDLLIVITEDISDRKNANSKINDLNAELIMKNRELESLNAELKTFNTITASDYTETLRQLYVNLEFIVNNDASQLSNTGRANLRRAQASIQKMKLLTEDLTGYLQLKDMDTRMQDVDLNILVRNVVDDFSEQLSKFNIIMDCDDMPHITGYPFLISLLFHHLINNAVKFRKNDSGHEIHILCRSSVTGSNIDNNQAEPGREYHIITVKDTGIGFAGAEAENIFQIFYRLHEKKQKGSGVGLAIAKKIMDMHYGFITSESEPGKGASFHCYFPAEQ